MVVDWPAEGGAADHLAPVGIRGEVVEGHFPPAAWNCFVNVTVCCRCCLQAGWLVGESPVSGQKPQPLSHML